MSQTKGVFVGQFWRDKVNFSLLKIEKLSLEPISQKVKQSPVWIEPHTVLTKDGKLLHVAGRFTEGAWVDGPPTQIEYAKCSVYGSNGKWFGIQDMKSSHLLEDRQGEPNEDLQRFEPLSWLAAYWVLGLARLRALWR